MHKLIPLLFVLLSALSLNVAGEEAGLAFNSTLIDSSEGSVNATHVYWGDTHLHTGNSFDVYLFGTPTSNIETAYRFAIGETVTMPTTGKDIKISQALDFLVIADHAEMVGSMPRLFDKDPIIADTKSGDIFKKISGDEPADKLIDLYNLIVQIASGQKNEHELTIRDLMRDFHRGNKRTSTWQLNTKLADKYNNPGTFSALIGWEWSSHPKGANLHRVVFTPQGAESANKYLPYSTFESQDPEDLWQWLEVTSKSTDSQFTAIPHNSNISAGLMFDVVKFNGEPIDAQYAKARNKWEKNVEITQIKGDSETHPMLSPNDEFADFETFNFLLNSSGKRLAPNKSDYVRSALRRGLELEDKVGVNPYALGIIGSTDSHTGVSAVEENNFGGKGQHDATPEQRPHATDIGSSIGWDMSSGGLTGAWAPENTRQNIFDAFVRREVYASTGPRITLRFFGGYGFTESDLKQNFVAAGYAKGVPMGSDLAPSNLRDNNLVPSFMVKAVKDPIEGNLDRIQIVKGWLNNDGSSGEKIYNIALSGQRTSGETAVGNTVDVKTGQYSNDIGAVELSALWTDPDFEAAQNAFYYARVLQIPTPRYSLLNALQLGIDPRSTNKPLTIQERAYSSPIWYRVK